MTEYVKLYNEHVKLYCKSVKNIANNMYSCVFDFTNQEDQEKVASLFNIDVEEVSLMKTLLEIKGISAKEGNEPKETMRYSVPIDFFSKSTRIPHQSNDPFIMLTLISFQEVKFSELETHKEMNDSSNSTADNTEINKKHTGMLVDDIANMDLGNLN